MQVLPRGAHRGLGAGSVEVVEHLAAEDGVAEVSVEVWRGRREEGHEVVAVERGEGPLGVCVKLELGPVLAGAALTLQPLVFVVVEHDAWETQREYSSVYVRVSLAVCG